MNKFLFVFLFYCASHLQAHTVQQVLTSDSGSFASKQGHYVLQRRTIIVENTDNTINQIDLYAYHYPSSMEDPYEQMKSFEFQPGDNYELSTQADDLDRQQLIVSRNNKQIPIAGFAYVKEAARVVEASLVRWKPIFEKNYVDVEYTYHILLSNGAQLSEDFGAASQISNKREGNQWVKELKEDLDKHPPISVGGFFIEYFEHPLYPNTKKGKIEVLFSGSVNVSFTETDSVMF